MSMSTQQGGGQRRPSVTRPGAKPTSGEAAADAAAAEAVEAEDAAEGADTGVETAAADTVDDAGDGAAATTGGAGTAAGGTSKSTAAARASSARPGAAKSAAGRTGSGKAAAGRPGAGKAAPGKAAAGKATPGKAVGGKAAPGKAVAGKATGARPGGARPAAGGKGGNRRPITPVRVAETRNWGPIALFLAVVVVAVGIIGFAAWQVREHSLSWQDRAKSISGVVNYRKSNPSLAKAGQHEWGPLSYPQSPPVGGTHNPNWQNCMGDVYSAPIASEHAVHSMEHGAVWVTYNPDKLSASQVDELAKKVRGKEYLLMSPYPGLDKPISVQAWGYQLKVDSPGDGRIDDFIRALRKNGGIEQGAVCSGGITETGTTPRDLGKDNQPQPAQTG
jgi:uncharacterized protein DUF3105